MIFPKSHSRLAARSRDKHPGLPAGRQGLFSLLYERSDTKIKVRYFNKNPNISGVSPCHSETLRCNVQFHQDHKDRQAQFQRSKCNTFSDKIHKHVLVLKHFPKPQEKYLSWPNSNHLILIFTSLLWSNIHQKSNRTYKIP